jgi:hypothetical protein
MASSQSLNAVEFNAWAQIHEANASINHAAVIDPIFVTIFG